MINFHWIMHFNKLPANYMRFCSEINVNPSSASPLYIQHPIFVMTLLADVLALMGPGHQQAQWWLQSWFFIASVAYIDFVCHFVSRWLDELPMKSCGTLSVKIASGHPENAEACMPRPVCLYAEPSFYSVFQLITLYQGSNLSNTSTGRCCWKWLNVTNRS